LKSEVSGVRPARERIMAAAMEAFMELGFARTSTLEIATRAQVSKRELYTLFGSKQAILAACTADRGQRMRLPPEVPAARTRDELAEALTKLGATLLVEICDPRVVGVFRLAITEAHAAPEVAQTLNLTRQSVRNSVREVIAKAASAGLLGEGDPDKMTGEFLSVLWGDLQISLLLRLREAPTPEEAQRRAQHATAVLLQLHPDP
jgi:AcrR family transcriptional regulator